MIPYQVEQIAVVEIVLKWWKNISTLAGTVIAETVIREAKIKAELLLVMKL